MQVREEVRFSLSPGGLASNGYDGHLGLYPSASGHLGLHLSASNCLMTTDGLLRYNGHSF